MPTSRICSVQGTISSMTTSLEVKGRLKRRKSPVCRCIGIERGGAEKGKT